MGPLPRASGTFSSPGRFSRAPTLILLSLALIPNHVPPSLPFSRSFPEMRNYYYLCPQTILLSIKLPLTCDDVLRFLPGGGTFGRPAIELVPVRGQYQLVARFVGQIIGGDEENDTHCPGVLFLDISQDVERLLFINSMYCTGSVSIGNGKQTN